MSKLQEHKDVRDSVTIQTSYKITSKLYVIEVHGRFDYF